MSRRNFILLIAILGVVVIGVSAFLYFRAPEGAPPAGSEGTNFVSDFSPFGTRPTPPSTEPAEAPPAGETISGSEAPQLKLEKVSSMGVAGFTVFTKERLKELPAPEVPTEDSSSTVQKTSSKPAPPPSEQATALRYVDQATGNIYQTFTDKIEERKFSGTVIPKVYEAYFGNGGNSVVMRYLKTGGSTIATFVGTLPKEELGGDSAENNEIKGSFLPDNVRGVSVSSDGAKMFYLFESGDSMIGTILDFKTNKKTQVFESAFTEWLSFWPTSSMITVSTKPSNNIPGYMYAINPTRKDLNMVLGGISGLTTLTSPNGKLVLYGENNLQGKLSLGIYHTDTRKTEILGIETLPEKCVWGEGSDFIYCAVPKTRGAGLFPDTWYQGEVSFNDRFWKIDAKTSTTTLLVDPAGSEGGEEIDGIKLALDGNEDYLFFVNKKDNFLWEIRLR